MAIGTIIRLSEGMGPEQYDAVQGQIDIEGEPVEGLIFHSAGELEGSFQVFNVWETREHFDRFRTERLRPAMVAAMLVHRGEYSARGCATRCWPGGYRVRRPAPRRGCVDLPRRATRRQPLGVLGIRRR